MISKFLAAAESGATRRERINKLIDFVNFAQSQRVFTGNTEEVALRGGADGNAFTTMSGAYARAISIIAGNPTKLILWEIGITEAAAVGDLVLTANYNTNVIISGLGKNVSILGNIIGSNAGGTGFNVGGFVHPVGATWENSIKVDGVTIGNIILTSTGATGSGGSFGFAADTPVKFGDIDTRCTASTNGHGGNIDRYYPILDSKLHQGAMVEIGNIYTSTVNTNACAGGVCLFSCQINDMTLSNNNCSFPVGISTALNKAHLELDFCEVNSVTSKDANISVNNHRKPAIIMRFCDVKVIDIRIRTQNLVGPTHIYYRSNLGTITHRTYNSNIVYYDYCRILTLDHDVYAPVFMNYCIVEGSPLVFGVIPDPCFPLIPNLSRISNSIIRQQIFTSNLPNPNYTDVYRNMEGAVIGQVGVDVRLFNVAVLNGKVSMDAKTAVTLSAINCYFQKRFNSLIDLELSLADGPTVIWDVSNFKNARLTIAGNRKLVIVNAIEGERYKLRVTQGTGGSRTLAMPDDTRTYGGTAGVVTLSTAVGAVDDINFTFDGVNLTAKVDQAATSNGIARKEVVQYENINSVVNFTFANNFTTDSGSFLGVCNVPGSSGGNQLVGGVATTTDTVTLKINTIGYRNLTIEWNALRYTGSPNSSTFEYSPDGVTWTAIVFTDAPATSTWVAMPPLSLPSSMNSLKECFVRWTITGVGYTSAIAIDDITIKGTP